MTRRTVAIVLALAGLAGTLLLTSTAASAQVGLPGIDIVALLRSILESLPPFVRDIFGPIFNALFRASAARCAPPFCASP